MHRLIMVYRTISNPMKLNIASIGTHRELHFGQTGDIYSLASRMGYHIELACEVGRGGQT